MSFRTHLSSKAMILRMISNNAKSVPQSLRSITTKKIASSAVSILTSMALFSTASSAKESYPIYGEGNLMSWCNCAIPSSSSIISYLDIESIMKEKAHGTSDAPVQKNLRWQCDENTADRICNYNRHWAEYSGYFASSKVSFMKEMQEKAAAGSTEPTIFYDSVTGKPLFKAPIGMLLQRHLLQ